MSERDGCLQSRKGALWRAEIALHIQDCLDGTVTAAELTDWAMDHPFFDDRDDLTTEEQHLIGVALGLALQIDPAESVETRTTGDQLRSLLTILWAG